MEPSSRFILEKESFNFINPCSRFREFPQNITEKRAIIYLELRKGGCGKRRALKFTSKIQCKTDVTQVKDGPIGFQVLKVKKNPEAITTNGWSPEPPCFDLGSRRYISTDDFLHKDPQSVYFEEQRLKQEQKTKDDYKKKLGFLKDYFEEISTKCDFTHLSREDLYRKLRHENAEFRKEKKPKDLDLASQQSLGQVVHEGYTSIVLNRANSRAVTLSPECSPKSAIKMSFQPKFSRPTFEVSSALTEEKKINSPDFSEGKKGFSKGHSPNRKVVEEFQSIDESELNEESRHLSRAKAYEDMENQTKMLYDMTNEDPREFSSEYVSGKKTGSATAQSLSQVVYEVNKTKVVRNDDLINEFNKINYFYLNHEEKEESAATLPIQKVMADEQSKQRKEQRLVQQDLFEKVINFQTQRMSESQRPFDPRNLQKLIAQKEGIKQEYYRKSIQKPAQKLSSTVTAPDFAHSGLGSRISDKDSRYLSPNNPSTTMTMRSINTLKLGSPKSNKSKAGILLSPKPGVRSVRTAVGSLRSVVSFEKDIKVIPNRKNLFPESKRLNKLEKLIRG